MSFYEDFKSDLFKTNEANFESKSLELFDYQYATNPVYQKFCNSLNRTPKTISKLVEIPFLPIELYKTHDIKSENWKPEKTFQSSGTTGMTRSKGHCRDLSLYEDVSTYIFESFYGKLENWRILALLPSYQEQGDSSLIYMIDRFSAKADPNSGYYSAENLIDNIHNQSNTLLIGVSYALLDVLQENSIDLSKVTIMETGGMKGRKKEITRSELHDVLTSGFYVDNIHTEYGMTELMSQAYSSADGNLKFPPWSKCLIRDINDPFTILESDKTGGINIIDFANISTCSFIQTSDIGKYTDNERFKVMGRFDNSDIRGCNLLS